MLAESSEWGLSKCVGISPPIFLCQGECCSLHSSPVASQQAPRDVVLESFTSAGARFRMTFHSQEVKLTWHGSRVKTEFTIPAMGAEVQPVHSLIIDHRS